MTTKLTLSADREVVQKVKRLAREQGTSVSALFDRFARAITSSPKKNRKIGPITRKLTGVIRLPKGKSDREMITEALLEKYDLK